MKTTSAAALAAVVASMFATASCGVGAEKETENPTSTLSQTVKCQGANECAGQGACQGTLADGGMHACAGANACKGQGWIELPSASACAAKGGRVL
jgi:hypothetical protein